jgi:DNA-binding transcriptional LysR family regulator
MARTPRPSLETIQAFSIFAETMNFNTAARALNISQPALHAKIGRLAGQLDVPLYLRSGRKLHLTRHGELVARYGRNLQSGLTTLLDQLAGRTRADRLVLAAGEGAFLNLLGPAIQAFKRELRRQTHLTLMTADRGAALEAVRAGKAHVGVAPLESVPEDLKAHTVCRVGQVLVVPKSHPLARKRSARLTDLAGAELVVPPAGQPHREMLARALHSAEVPWSVAVEAGGWELMVQFVRMGFGLTIVNDYCRLGPGLAAIKLPELPSLVFRLFHLRGVEPHDTLSRLVETILEHGAGRAH